MASLHNAFWKSSDLSGLERLRMVMDDGISAGVSAVSTGEPSYSLQYTVRSSHDLSEQVWNIQCRSNGGYSELALIRNADGWSMYPETTAISEFSSVKYVDVFNSPFTNFFPIRDLVKSGKGSMDIDVLFVLVPELSIRLVRQGYRKISDNEFTYVSFSSGEEYQIRTDEIGLVTDYEGFWERS